MVPARLARAVDELATNEPGSLTKGMGYTVPILAEAIREMCERWKVQAARRRRRRMLRQERGQGADSIAEEFRARRA